MLDASQREKHTHSQAQILETNFCDQAVLIQGQIIPLKQTMSPEDFL